MFYKINIFQPATVNVQRNTATAPTQQLGTLLSLSADYKF